MSAKSIISCCKYQLYRMRLIPLWFVIYVFASILLSAIMISVINKVPFSLSYVSSGDFDMFMGLMLFGFMCSLMGDFLNTAAANGISRTTACISSFISSVICSVVSAIEVSVLYPIVSFITGYEEVWGASFYGSVFTLQEAGWGMFAIRLRFLGICIFAYIASSTIGLLLSSMVYKLPKFVSLTIIFAMIFIPTAGVYMLGENVFMSFWNSIFKILGLAITNDMLIGSALQGAAVCIGLSLVLLILSCLITRHSSAKPLAIKSD